jgi:hypothetical protein
VSELKLPAIERPNGKVYRPRKIDMQPLGTEDEVISIVVFGTHDRRYAKTMLEADLKQVCDDFYGDSWMTLELQDDGRAVWLRQELACFNENDQPVYYFVDDPDKGRAAVRFAVEEVEVSP